MRVDVLGGAGELWDGNLWLVGLGDLFCTKSVCVFVPCFCFIFLWRN